ncbi:hypothetical protein [Legionella londiniensis]|uniref:Uncharacterized protein n=1 Tax=Legionella londiniensis TaxID=45068 RepID=A0A0W0VNP0_9GAMM|nr:hypothetical protein [Legionella londiniensis]KTD21695.1 hypothetical protein Llon_0860 [Legionella londiniensis]STX93470.1 Uncharacterised protein [Legionella londiniensis]
MRMIPLIAASLLCFPMINHAAEIPTVEEGAEVYDEKMCVDRYANECINTVCLTSEARDCQDKCYQEAKDKCLEQMGTY